MAWLAGGIWVVDGGRTWVAQLVQNKLYSAYSKAVYKLSLGYLVLKKNF